MNNHIFIQARIGSTRLPGKVLMKIHDKTILELILERLKKVDHIERVILVTGPEDKNIVLVNEAKQLDLDYFCGSEENLLDRYYKAASEFGSENIIRITADCPLIDFNLINSGLRIFKSGYDIVCVGRIPSFPHGLDFEIFKTSALNIAWKNTFDKYRNLQEFNSTFICPTEYILKSPGFKKYDFVSDVDMSKIRITLDYPEDFELISKIYESLYDKKKYFTLEDILELVKDNPHLLLINSKYVSSRTVIN